jgi:phospholipase C
MSMKRRDALKTIGGLAGAAALSKFLPACGDDGGGGPVGITTYVYMMLENRTYDHVLGARSWKEGKPGDGLHDGVTLPDLNGTATPIFEPQNIVTQMCVGNDPDHSWTGSRREWNNGANDGFLKVHQSAFGAGAEESIQYLTRTEQPVTWALADAYTTCDRWFSSILGPTLPNRFFWHAATSAGFTSNAVLSNVSTLSLPTIYHRLKDKNVDWAYYYGSLPVVAALAQFTPPYDLPNDYITPRVRRFGDSVEGMGQFFKDAAAGTLPPVTYIDPFFYLNDDHPPAHPMLAQQLLAAVYTALAKSPQWKNLMFVVTYDEHGGFYDHVAPPKTMDDTVDKFAVDIVSASQSGMTATFMTAKPHNLENGVSVRVSGASVAGYNGSWIVASRPDGMTFTATLTTAGLGASTGGKMGVEGFDQLGFRVPALIIGPYAKKGYVSSVEYNHVSALKHLQNAFGLESLNVRMDAANDLTDCIDMERLAAGDWEKPIDVPKIEVKTDANGITTAISVDGTDWPWTESACQLEGAGLRTFNDPISAAADKDPTLFGGLDLRSSHAQYLNSIDEFLKKNQG